MLRRLSADRRRPRPGRRDRAVRRRAAAVRRRVVRPRDRSRRAAPPARPRPRDVGVRACARAGRHARVHGRAVAPRRPDRRAAEVDRQPGRAGLAQAAYERRAKRATGRTSSASRATHATRAARRRAHLHARRAARDGRHAPGSSTCACRGEELLANVYGWLMRSARGGRRRRESVPRAWHQFAFRSYLALQWIDGRLLEPRLPAEPLLQPAAVGAQAGLILSAFTAPKLCRGWPQRSPTSRCSRCRSCCCRPRSSRCTSSRTATRR